MDALEMERRAATFHRTDAGRRFQHWSFFLALTLLALSLSLTALVDEALAVSTDYLKLAAGTTYQLADSDQGTIVSIPVVVRRGVRPASLRVAVVFVGRGGWTGSELSSAVNARLQRVSGRWATIVLGIGKTSLMHPGAYAVLLSVAPRTAKADVGQVIRLKLKRPVAALDLPDTVLIQRRIWLPWKPSLTFGSQQGDLVLHEESGVSPLLGLRIVQTDQAKMDDQIVTGRVSFGGLDLPAGGMVTATPSPASDFGVGSSTGTLLVDSPQLAQPVHVGFVVVTRLTSLWIFVVAIVAVTMSFLLKKVSANRIARLRARVDAGQLLMAMGEDIESHGDEEYRESLRGIGADLRRAIEGDDPAAMAGAVTEAAQAYQDATDSLNERNRLQLSRLNQLQKALQDVRSVTLPEAANKATKEAWDRLPEAAEAVRHLAADRAESALNEMEQTLSPAIDSAVFEWGDHLSPLLHEGAKVDAIQPVAIETKTKLEKVMTRKMATDKLEQLKAAVLAYGSMLAATHDYATTAQAGLDSVDSDATMMAAQEARKQAQTLSVAPDSDVKDLAQSIEVVAYTTDRGRAGTPPSVTPPGPPGSAVGSSGPPISVSRSEPGKRVILVGDIEARSDIAHRLSSERSQLAWLRAVQSVIVAILVALIAYSIYGPQFVGTWTELLTIFFWAFGLDLGVASVVELAKTRGPSAEAAKA